VSVSLLTALAVPCALWLDRLYGELPNRWHPLVAFGRWANACERRLYGPRRWRGLLAWGLAVLPPVWLVHGLLPRGSLLALAGGIALLYLALGARSLEQHARAVATALAADDLDAARRAVGCIVSRDTAALDARGVALAAVESVLENGADAIFGALFWFVAGGPAAVVLYRLANTLDAMWGYRNARYAEFGWAAARIDDALNFIPARLTAASYALLGDRPRAWRCWRTQAPHWKSPNAGPVMASGAGALGLALGGGAVYHGRWQERPPLGEGRAPAAADIERALALVRRTTLLWAAVIVLGGFALA